MVRWQLLIRRPVLWLTHVDDKRDRTSWCPAALIEDMVTWNRREARGSQGQGPNASPELEQIMLTLSLS